MELLCFLMPFAVVGVAGIILTSVDLVRRDHRVGWWWALPFAATVPIIGFTLVLPPTIEPGGDRTVLVAGGWAVFHLAVAALWLFLSAALALSRGLRPGGATIRRRRTSVGAIGVMLLLLLLPWIPGLHALMWVVPAAWAGLIWVLAFNRRGPSRLEWGKVVSASWMFAAALSFLLAAAHGFRAAALEGEPLVLGGVGWGASLGVFTALCAGFRWLSGPPAPGPLLATVATGASLVFTWAYDLSFDPAPTGVQVPRWVDFEGRDGGVLGPYRRHGCLKVVDVEGVMSVVGPRCPGYYEPVLADARTPLMQVRDLDGDTLDTTYFVGDRRRLDGWRSEGRPLRVFERDGAAWIVGPDGPQRLGTLKDVGEWVSAKLNGRAVHVERTWTWTMQDFVSICASADEDTACALVDPTD